ncbi:MAG: uroporphyrinogen-III synthase [Terriglobia bacterium]
MGKKPSKVYKPLLGRRIVITRTREQARSLRAALEAQGAVVHELPTIALAPPPSWQPLDAALCRLGSYDWVVFTSANGVENFFARLKRAGKNAHALAQAKLAAIGPATAEALRRQGVVADVVPREFRAEGLVAAFGRVRWRGKRVLVARAAAAREVLPRELQRRGARVDVVAVYQTVLAVKSRQAARKLFAKQRPDIITFTSSSTARNFAALLGRRQARRVLRDMAIAAIGPVTAATVRRLGWRVAVTSNPHTIPALVRAIVGYFGRLRPSPRRGRTSSGM